MRKRMADWSNLPADLLLLIAKRLHFAEDYAKISAVCKSWRAIILQKDNQSCSLLPWLMLTENESRDIRGFYSPFNKKVCELYLPEIRGKRCWGSSHGWLITLNTAYEMHLLNPMSRVQILLPPLHICSNLKNLICNPTEFRNTFVYKVVLSSDPLSGNCVALAVYSDNKMAFAKLGDDAWTPLQCCPSVINDVICFGGKFYATDSSGDVISCDMNGIHLKTLPLTSSFEAYELDEITTYIVEIGGKIHVVLRFMYEDRYGDGPFLRTWNFKIYGLDVCTEKWEEVGSLGNWSIFVGSNDSFSVSCYDYPECRSNCVYFSDDYSERYYDNSTTFNSFDMGICSLDNHKIQPLFENDSSSSVYSVPVWMKPILW
ncbi:hypothetical protein BUALT_Bualt10G0091800 [Buddleja alternifolia]|uniref:F-box protein n=1 Tax=Buddleja alternifolia TaxID=168488 RepID=A0AAV6WYD5_9LAMI|nr:hypothetical protein BUALT_Bualt10G0091800 [Buddleja alternifolia]